MDANKLYEKLRPLLGKKVSKISKQTVEESTEYKQVNIMTDDGEEIFIRVD